MRTAMAASVTLVAGLASPCLANGPSSTIAGGYAHAVAITQSGEATGWGYDELGQLWFPEGETPARVAASGQVTVWLLADGSALATGEFDDGTKPPTNTDFVDVATADGIALGLRANGTLYWWGRFGSIPGSPPAGTYLKIAGAGSAFSFIRTDGSLAAWGTNFMGALDVPPGNDYVALGGGPVAIRADGSLAVWHTAVQALVPPGPGFHTASVSGHTMVVALRRNGVIYAAGQTKEFLPVQGPTGNDFVMLTSTGQGAIGVRSNGEVVGFGGDNAGELSPPAGTLIEIPDDALVPCIGDADGVGGVNFADLNAVLSFFGQSGIIGFVAADVDGTGVVDFGDLNVVLSNFGTSCD